MVDKQRELPCPISPLARAFPPLRPSRYDSLVTSIRQHGLRRPIILWRGKIIDGVHWLKACMEACMEAGVEPRVETLDDDDPLPFLTSEAVPFRENENERAMDQVLSRFCLPGQVVADPVMLNRAGTALAARKAGCTFIGATEVESCRDHIANNKTQVKPPGLPFL